MEPVQLSEEEKAAMGDVALYIGSGDDVDPIRALPHIRTFIYVESQVSHFYRVWRHDSLDDKAKSVGFTRASYGEERHVSLYQNEDGSRRIYFYWDHRFPERLTGRLLDRMREAKTLILIGANYPVGVLEALDIDVIIGSGRSYYPRSIHECFELDCVNKLGYSVMTWLYRTRQCFTYYCLRSRHKKRPLLPTLHRCKDYADLSRFDR